MNGRATRMRLPALALFAIAGLLPGAANTAIPGGPGGDTPRAYPSHVIGAGTSQWNGQALPGTVTLGGETTQVPRRRVVNSSHYPGFVTGAGSSQAGSGSSRADVPAGEAQQPRTTSSSLESDVGAFAAGAGAVALLGAVLAGVLIAVRKRHSVGLP